MGNGRKIGLEIESYLNVKESEVEWLWYPYIPYGKLTLLQGDPGDGKSTFMIHIAACVTTASSLPDGNSIPEPQNVIYQCSEDNVSDTIKPRLLAAGADCSKIMFISEEERTLTIDDERIEKAIIETAARLLIIDPLQAYIPADYDMMNAASMRALMRKLNRIAEKQHCAIVLIGHMTKATGGKNLYRSLGSIDIAAVARSVLMIKRDENYPEVRYMFPIKTSLAFEGDAIQFMFDKITGFRFLGPCDINDMRYIPDGETIFQRKSEQVEDLILRNLTSGRLPSAKVLSIIKEHGISERTARTVAKKIGVKSKKEGGIWYWQLNEK